MKKTMKENTNHLCPNCDGKMEQTTNESDEIFFCKKCGCSIDKKEFQNYDSIHASIVMFLDQL